MQIHDSASSSKAFGKRADPGLVVAYRSHQDALRFLSSALKRSNGVAVLRGPAGSGKSTTLRELYAWSLHDKAVAIVDGEHLSPRAFILNVLEQYGVEALAGDDDQKLLQRLNTFVTKQARESDTPVLIVDDADKAPSTVLRLLNWLAALESRDRFVVRILLAGRAGLGRTIKDDGMRNIARRHPSTYSLNPLTENETKTYLRTRWIAAGGSRAERVFPVDVCTRLLELSAGWPGALNKYAGEVVDRIAELEPSRAVPILHVTRDGQTLKSIRLTKREYVIGRSELSDILIEDSYVSKVHAMVRVYGNAVMLIDLNSTNGTTVNSRIVQKTVLRSDDIIVLGHYRLKIENVPAMSTQMEEQVAASDTVRIQHLGDLRRARARHTVKALKHK